MSTDTERTAGRANDGSVLGSKTRGGLRISDLERCEPTEEDLIGNTPVPMRSPAQVDGRWVSGHQHTGDRELVEMVLTSTEASIYKRLTMAAGSMGHTPALAAEEFELLVGEAAKRGPVARMQMAQMLWTHRLMHRLANILGCAEMDKQIAHYTDLYNRTANTFRKQAVAYEALGAPKVHVGSADQVNVTTGPQQVVNGASLKRRLDE